jgi:hypothetical protein
VSIGLPIAPEELVRTEESRRSEKLHDMSEQLMERVDSA